MTTDAVGGVAVELPVGDQSARGRVELVEVVGLDIGRGAGDAPHAYVVDAANPVFAREWTLAADLQRHAVASQAVGWLDLLRHLDTIHVQGQRVGTGDKGRRDVLPDLGAE